jgi:hypothetical protein
VARLTNYRRAVRRPHEDHRRLPVIFNDYMNTLMGDPTTDRLAPLITAAARAGAEYFCTDSGWYSELGENWWDTVGAWTPSQSRFPNGLTEVLELIRAEGMVAGLWLEPEVIGVHSPVSRQLPSGAFFSRNGERVVEQGRYHLDFSRPAAGEYLDRVVDFLVEDLGVGYLKMDYNMNVGPGTETGGRLSSGQERLVAGAINVYKQIRPDLAAAAPFWPLGLPGWTDPWVALGMRARSATYVVVWHRARAGDTLGAGDGAGPAEMVLPVPHLRDVPAGPELLYPKTAGAEAHWSAAGELTVALPRTPSACLIRLATQEATG